MASGLPQHLIRSKATPGLSAYCLLNDQSAEAIAPWDLGQSARKQGADYVVEEDMSFEVGLVDKRDYSEIEEEGYEAILFLDGKQTTSRLVSAQDDWFKAPRHDPKRMIRFAGLPDGNVQLMTCTRSLFLPFRFQKTEIIAPEDDHDGTAVRDLAAHRATGTAQIRLYRLSDIEDIEAQAGDSLEVQTFVKHPGGMDKDGNPVAKEGIKCLSSVVAGTGRPRFLRESIPWRKAMRIDDLDAPFFTFEFHFDVRERFVGLNRISDDSPVLTSISKLAAPRRPQTAPSSTLTASSLQAFTQTSSISHGNGSPTARSRTATTEVASSTGDTNHVGLEIDTDATETEDDDEGLEFQII